MVVVDGGSVDDPRLGLVVVVRISRITSAGLKK